jgi:cobalamin biosynthesis Mg chelatase CobN
VFVASAQANGYTTADAAYSAVSQDISQTSNDGTMAASIRNVATEMDADALKSVNTSTASVEEPVYPTIEPTAPPTWAPTERPTTIEERESASNADSAGSGGSSVIIIVIVVVIIVVVAAIVAGFMYVRSCARENGEKDMTWYLRSAVGSPAKPSVDISSSARIHDVSEGAMIGMDINDLKL